MRYNLDDTKEADEAFTHLTKLVGQHAEAEVKKVVPGRSLRQNNYLHLLLGAFGMHFGYTLEEAKIIYKEINSSVYKYKKKGRTFLRSSADIDKDEMTRSIDQFRLKSAEAGCELPLATNQDWLRSIENAMEQHRYL